jgi:hypothetical protein
VKRSLEPVGVINWHEALIRANLELDILGSALIPIVNPVETTHLHQRRAPLRDHASLISLVGLAPKRIRMM